MATTVNLFTALTGNVTLDKVHAMFADFYKDSRFITVLPLHGGKDAVNFVSANEMTGKDSMKIFISGNDERIFITSIFDNLGKGASGAAIQCMNISMGADETSSLVL